MSPGKKPDVSSRCLLIAALEALDREGDRVAAAYVAMALAHVDRRPPAPPFVR